jgi:hypothetical protein
MRLRLRPEDDLLHPLEEATNFNESAYYNFHDRGCGLGGWVRLGNRANEGYAEMTTCLYLPDGRVAFWFARPTIVANDAHDAGGLRFEVVRPFEEHRVTYEGPALLLDEPAQMEDPRRAFGANPGCRAASNRSTGPWPSRGAASPSPRRARRRWRSTPSAGSPAATSSSTWP